MAECPTSIEELDELERLLPLCRVTLYNQAKARIESGAAKSVSEAARQLADETGKNVDGIRRRIFEEAKRDGGVRPAQIAGTSKFNPYQSEKSPYASSANKPVSESEQEIDDDLDDEPEQDILQQETPSHQEQPRYNHRALGTGENEWYTPSEYIDAVKTVFGEIDLDPASSEHAQKTISANSFYTIEDDGLTQKWYGNVWMNPPYTQPEIKHFIQKLVDEYNSGNVTQAIALTHNYTDTSWFHIAAIACSAMCLTRGRIAFINPEGKKAAPTQGQVFLYFGNDTKKFQSVFSEFGIVLTRAIQ